MIKRISLLIAAALLVATMAVMTTAPLFAAPFNQNTCEGTFTYDQGNKRCVESKQEQAGQSGNKFEEETTTTRRGPTTSQPTTTCRNPSGDPKPGECKRIK